MQAKTIRIAIAAGEYSGDELGYSLVTALKNKFPQCNFEFEGVTGPKMEQAGVKSLVSIDKFNVMGIFAVIPKLPNILFIRRQLLHRWCKKHKPDLFIGIDNQDFNLSLYKKLKSSQVKTIQFVSPSVWAWRRGRIKIIKKYVDLVLSILPFERNFYFKHNAQISFVGHPLADRLPIITPEDKIAKTNNFLLQHNFAKNKYKLIGLLPGSRVSEINHHMKTLIDTARLLVKSETINNYVFIVPYINDKHKEIINKFLSNLKVSHDLTILLKPKADMDYGCLDAAVVASGTATLELMLNQVPMVVMYKISALTFYVVKRLIKTKFISLPNLIADRKLVTELIQKDATSHNIYKELQIILDEEHNRSIRKTFALYHQNLKLDAIDRAANNVMTLLRAQ